jgi:1-deoxy-D-xylulose-5-phosphate synthase
MDETYLLNLKSKFTKVLTIEEGVLTGGFGSSVSDWLTQNGYMGTIHKMGLPDSFVEHGPRQVLLHKFDLDNEGIIKTVRKLIRK